ncbi:hypothetical protein Pcinc_019446 [Petrolisthes cinctipes]|uniref:COPA/B TPR domain-containing protein n=1 Tax=Petrolisthes cinctipes TaxID=88211 RepID=A0AAE1FK96_PETCI|nr:hypothetical protein Pcinc_019446 [Petrolisthes cinctipes]
MMCYCVTRQPDPQVITIDPVEYKFKLALFKHEYNKVVEMANSGRLVGEAMLWYLYTKGYKRLALYFNGNVAIRFQFSLELGELRIALKAARQLDDEECWRKLSQEAILHGDIAIAETCYQKSKSYEKLSFLYLITGNLTKLRKMLNIHKRRRDYAAWYTNALYLGDVKERLCVLKECG